MVLVTRRLINVTKQNT